MTDPAKLRTYYYGLVAGVALMLALWRITDGVYDDAALAIVFVVFFSWAGIRHG